MFEEVQGSSDGPEECLVFHFLALFKNIAVIYNKLE